MPKQSRLRVRRIILALLLACSGIGWSAAPAQADGIYWGAYTLTAKHSMKCLDVAYFAQNDGGDVVQSWCSGQPNQTWYATRYQGRLELVAAHSGKCLDVATSSLQHAADVVQWSCAGNARDDSQLWRYYYIKTVNGIPYYLLENEHSWKCLDVAYFSQAIGGNVLQADCTATDNQLWDLRDVNFGTHGM